MPRRDALRRIMTNFAQTSGVLPGYLMIKRRTIVKDVEMGAGAYGSIARCIWHKQSLADRIMVVTKTLTPRDSKTTEEIFKVRIEWRLPYPTLTVTSDYFLRSFPSTALGTDTSFKLLDCIARLTSPVWSFRSLRTTT